VAKPRVIASASYKGGPGKSFLATTMAGLLQEAGKRVLVVDLDGQCAQTQNLGVDVDPERTMEHWLDGMEDPTQLVHPSSTPRIGVIPAHPDIVNVQHNQETYTQVKRLVAALGSAWDYVVLDTAPASHPLAVSALLACDFYVMPLRPAVKEVVNSLLVFDRDVGQARTWNPAMVDLGIVVNQFDHQAPEQVRIVNQLRKRCGDRVVAHPIGVSRDVVNAEKAGKPVTIHKPNSRLTRNVRKTFQPILARVTS